MLLYIFILSDDLRTLPGAFARLSDYTRTPRKIAQTFKRVMLCPCIALYALYIAFEYFVRVIIYFWLARKIRGICKRNFDMAKIRHFAKFEIENHYQFSAAKHLFKIRALKKGDLLAPCVMCFCLDVC